LQASRQLLALQLAIPWLRATRNKGQATRCERARSRNRH